MYKGGQHWRNQQRRKSIEKIDRGIAVKKIETLESKRYGWTFPGEQEQEDEK